MWPIPKVAVVDVGHQGARTMGIVCPHCNRLVACGRYMIEITINHKIFPVLKRHDCLESSRGTLHANIFMAQEVACEEARMLEALMGLVAAEGRDPTEVLIFPPGVLAQMAS